MMLIDVAEVVEILFARGLVKVLFATETFAMVRLFLSSLKALLIFPSGCQYACEIGRVLWHS